MTNIAIVKTRRETELNWSQREPDKEPQKRRNQDKPSRLPET